MALWGDYYLDIQDARDLYLRRPSGAAGSATLRPNGDVNAAFSIRRRPCSSAAQDLFYLPTPKRR